MGQLSVAISTVTTAPDTAVRRDDRRLLWFVLLNVLIANVGFKLIAHFVFHTGVDEQRGRYMDFLHFRQFTDSWTPMLGSVDSFLANPGLPIYQAKLYDTLIYPLTSILPLLWMRQAGMSDAAVFRTMMLLSWLAVCAVVAVAVMIAAKVVGPGRLTWRAGVATAGRGRVLLHADYAGVFAGAGADIFRPLLRTAGALLGSGEAAASGCHDGAAGDGEAAVRSSAVVAALRKRWNAMAA